MRNSFKLSEGWVTCNHREAYFLASEIRPLINEHFQSNSYERVNFNILFAHIAINASSVETFVLESMTDTQAAISNMQWPGEVQAEIMNRSALAHGASMRKTWRSAVLMEENLTNFIKSHEKTPILYGQILMSSFALRIFTFNPSASPPQAPKDISRVRDWFDRGTSYRPGRYLERSLDGDLMAIRGIDLHPASRT